MQRTDAARSYFFVVPRTVKLRETGNKVAGSRGNGEGEISNDLPVGADFRSEDTRISRWMGDRCTTRRLFYLPVPFAVEQYSAIHRIHTCTIHTCHHLLIHSPADGHGLASSLGMLPRDYLHASVCVPWFLFSRVNTSKWNSWITFML